MKSSAELEPPFVREQRQRALTLEKMGELQQAISSWQKLLSVMPEDQEAMNKLSALKSLAAQKAARHFAMAQRFVKKKEMLSGAYEAVMALRYDPGHEGALALLGQDWRTLTHKVKKGETLGGIAQKYYNDATKAPVIAHYSNFPNEKVTILPGMLLSFPDLSTISQAQQLDAELEKMFAAARQEFRQKKYHKAIVLVKKIMKKKPYEQEAHLVLNKSYLAIAQTQLNKGEYSQAEIVLKQVEDGFPGLQESWEDLAHKKRESAEDHYRQGVKYYLGEKLTEAIHEWQQVLKLFPGHNRARQNIKKARAILEKLKAVH